MDDSSARLTILNGPLTGKELVLEEIVDNILIGSDGACRFHLPSPGISPIHARIWMDAAGVTVYDTHSPRGLYVNDDRVNGQALLHNGDVLWLGTPGEEEAIMIQVRLPPRGGPAAAEAAPAAAEPESGDLTDRTVSIPAPGLAVEPEAIEVVEDTTSTVAMPALSLDAFSIAEPAPEADDAESTMVMAVSPDLEPVAVSEPEPESDRTIVDYARPVRVEPAEAFYVAEPAAPAEEPQPLEDGYALAPEPEVPVKFALDIPPAPPSEPPSFEDETVEQLAVGERPATPQPPAPAPVIARPTAPPPAPRAPRPAAAPAVPAAPPPRPVGASSAGKYAALAGIGVLVLAGGGFAAWRMLQPSTTPAIEEAPPVTVAVAPDPVQVAPPPVTEPPTTLAPEPLPEPPVEEAVTIVKSPPPTLAAVATRPGAASPAATKATLAPAPTTLSPELARAQQAATQVTTLLSRADSLAAARDFAGAAQAYDEVLKVDASNARAGEAKGTALAAVASLKKTFVPGRTSVQSGKAAKGGVSGFDSEDVSVAKAPDYSGRIDFEASPRSVKAGDSFTVIAYLTNDGKKSFKIQGVTVNTVSNGERSGGPVSPRDKDLEPQQRVLLAELPGTWQAGAKTWAVEVSVTSNRSDTFKNTLNWK